MPFFVRVFHVNLIGVTVQKGKIVASSWMDNKIVTVYIFVQSIDYSYYNASV